MMMRSTFSSQWLWWSYSRLSVSPGSALKRFTLTHLVVQVTHSAHYFQQLYEYAVKLIETGNAFVDHQTAEEVKLYR